MQMKCYDSTPSFQVGGEGLTPSICTNMVLSSNVQDDALSKRRFRFDSVRGYKYGELNLARGALWFKSVYCIHRLVTIGSTPVFPTTRNHG